MQRHVLLVFPKCPTCTYRCNLKTFSLLMPQQHPTDGFTAQWHCTSPLCNSSPEQFTNAHGAWPSDTAWGKLQSTELDFRHNWLTYWLTDWLSILPSIQSNNSITQMSLLINRTTNSFSVGHLCLVSRVTTAEGCLRLHTALSNLLFFLPFTKMDCKQVDTFCNETVFLYFHIQYQIGHHPMSAVYDCLFSIFVVSWPLLSM
jgi:hypothetical protein